MSQLIIILLPSILLSKRKVAVFPTANTSDCVVFIQVEGFVVINASFAGTALNHHTCTNLLIYLRAVGVAVHIILRFYGLAEHVPVGNVHCESLVDTERWCFLVMRNSYFGDLLKEFPVGCNMASESHTELPRRRVLPVIKVFQL